MKCLDAVAITRIESLGLADSHVESCAACQQRIERERGIAALVRGLPSRPQSARRRRELGFALVAAAQDLPRRRRDLPMTYAASLLAVAAAVALLVSASSPRLLAPKLDTALTETVALESSTVVTDDPAPPEPAPSPPRVDASAGAVFTHVAGDAQDSIVLVDGTLQLDTREAHLVEVRVGATRVRVDNASVVVTARARRILSVQVVVGSARIDSPQQRVTLQHDSLWIPSPSASQRSMAIYRDGWIALRAGRNHEAMALFDRVTDPVAQEDAMYWAAIAAQRSGETALARKRIADFLARFPRSDYAAQLATPAP
jgi:TolA-binding protein